MKFSNNFKILYWLVLIIFLTVYLLFRIKSLINGNFNSLDILIFIFWFSMLIFPLVKEINILGVNFKQEIEDVKREVKDSINSLKMELKNNINFQPIINLTTGKANEEEIEDKIQGETKDIGKKENSALTVSKNEENEKAPLKEYALQRFNKIKKVEELVFKKLTEKYGDDFVSNLKVENNFGKKIILDGVLLKNNKPNTIIEIKYISIKSLEALKYIGSRYIKRLLNVGMKLPINFIIVSDEINETDAYKIKRDFNFISFVKNISADSSLPKITTEFYKFDNGNLVMIEPKAAENE